MYTYSRNHTARYTFTDKRGAECTEIVTVPDQVADDPNGYVGKTFVALLSCGSLLVTIHTETTGGAGDLHVVDGPTFNLYVFPPDHPDGLDTGGYATEEEAWAELPRTKALLLETCVDDAHRAKIEAAKWRVVFCPSS